MDGAHCGPLTLAPLPFFAPPAHLVALQHLQRARVVRLVGLPGVARHERVALGRCLAHGQAVRGGRQPRLAVRVAHGRQVAAPHLEAPLKKRRGVAWQGRAVALGSYHLRLRQRQANARERSARRAHLFPQRVGRQVEHAQVHDGGRVVAAAAHQHHWLRSGLAGSRSSTAWHAAGRGGRLSGAGTAATRGWPQLVHRERSRALRRALRHVVCCCLCDLASWLLPWAADPRAPRGGIYASRERPGERSRWTTSTLRAPTCA